MFNDHTWLFKKVSNVLIFSRLIFTPPVLSYIIESGMGKKIFPLIAWCALVPPSQLLHQFSHTLIWEKRRKCQYSGRKEERSKNIIIEETQPKERAFTGSIYGVKWILKKLIISLSSIDQIWLHMHRSHHF